MNELLSALRESGDCRPDRATEPAGDDTLTTQLPPLTIQCALPTQANVVSSVLTEAAAWIASRGMPLWPLDHLSVASIADEVSRGAYFIAWHDGEAAGVVKLEPEDPQFWPEAAAGEALYLHRLAVRRRYAGGTVSSAILKWAVRRAAHAGRFFVRLDCAADRPALRAVYERFGFQLHSERTVGEFAVARYQRTVAGAVGDTG